MRVPPVTIIIPTYNRATFLPATIASVLCQTMQNFELIIVDDGSTDETQKILADFVNRDPRVRVVINGGAYGPGPARNAGLAQARSEWIAFLDSDDLWKADMLERFLAAAQHDVVMIGSDYEMIDRKQGSRRTMRSFIFDQMMPWWEQNALATRVIDCARLRASIGALADADMMIGMTIGGFLWPHTSSVMTRRTDLEALGGFDPDLARTEDMDMWLRLLPRGRIAYVDKVLAIYDISGRDGGAGDRYETHDPARRHDAYSEARYHLRFLKTLPSRVVLNADQVAFLAERIADHQRMCGYAARKMGSPAAAWHYAAALTSSAEHRRMMRGNWVDYFKRR